jgi:hypothetical protein
LDDDHAIDILKNCLNAINKTKSGNKEEDNKKRHNKNGSKKLLRVVWEGIPKMLSCRIEKLNNLD